MLQTLSYQTKRDDNDTVDHFIANVRASDLRKDPSFVIGAVERYMKRKWYLLINETRVSLKAEFSGMREFFIQANVFKPKFFHNLNNTDKYQHFTWSVIRDYFALMPKKSLLTITEMFYCNQIALNDDEYEMDREKYIMRYDDKDYLDGEFSYVTDAKTGAYIPRICIYNTGFIRQYLNGMNGSDKSYLFAFTIIVYHSLVITE